jgi:hypothetical protein
MVALAEKFGVGENIKVDEEQTIANYVVRAIKPHDLIWSVDAEETEDARVFGFKDVVCLKDLKAMGYDVKNITSYIKGTDEWKQRLEELDKITQYQATSLLMDMSVNVAFLYTRLLNDQKYYEYHLVTMAYTDTGEPQTIKFEENNLDEKFIPMGVFRPIDRLGKFYGFGLIEPSIGVLDAEEDLFNMAMEALYTDISKPMEYDPTNLLDVDSLEYRPRTLVPVRELGRSVLPMLTPQLPTGSVQFGLDFLQRTKQNITSITDFQTGAEQLSAGKTLGEVRIKTQESNARIGMIVESYEEQVLEPIGKYALWMNKQFLSDKKKKYYYRVVGRKGAYLEKQIKSNNIEAVKDIVIVSGSAAMVDQVAEYQKWQAFLNAAYMETKMQNPVPINREAIWERFIEQGMLISDTETYLPSVKEREESNVANKNAQLDDVLQENQRPFTARVLPTDNPKIHIPLHQDEIEARTRELQQMQQQDPQLVQELQALTQHLNDHAAQAGGSVPQFSQGMQVGQGLEGEIPQGPGQEQMPAERQ